MAAGRMESRIIWLERQTPSAAVDLRRVSDEELRQALFSKLRQKIANPASTVEQVQRARRMLALPWGQPTGEWTTDDLTFLCDEAHHDD